MEWNLKFILCQVFLLNLFEFTDGYGYIIYL